jgi:murein DD-endopeptidase MepM/ murein hydrolase activator NlpD
LSATSTQYQTLKNRVASLEAAAARAAAIAATTTTTSKSATTTTTTKKPPNNPPPVKPGSFVFPVNGPHSYADTFGAPRSGGRTHKGCDIMAPRGTPVVASVTGRITSLSRSDVGLSGLYFWLSGDNGTGYFGCHLESLAPNIQVGTRVVAGQLLGYVGNTGNAAGGPTHLHFEIHPGEGAAIDPYPILRAND